MTESGIRVVLFDLDGVLVDSHEAWFRVVNDAAKVFGAPAVTRERFAGVWGQGISADVKNLYPGKTHAEVEAAYERAMSTERASIEVNPEAASVLDALGVRGLARALVTNTQVRLARAILAATDLERRFEAVEGMSEGRREKPAPDLLLAALERCGATADDALMVGDSRYDREAAEAAGVPYLEYDLRTGASLSEALERAFASQA